MDYADLEKFLNADEAQVGTEAIETAATGSDDEVKGEEEAMAVDPPKPKTKEEIQSEKSQKVVQALHKILRPFLLRRVKADVEKGLLPSTCFEVESA